jgi:hypothetical protein
VVQGSDRAAIQLKIDKLGAVYTSLGQVTADVSAASAEVTSLENALATRGISAVRGEGDPDGWTERYFLGPKVKKLANFILARDTYIADVDRMRDEFAEEVMSAAKEGERQYNAVMADQLDLIGCETALVTIVDVASSLLANMPAAPTDGTKAARQPDQPVQKLQQEGVKEASVMFEEVMRSLKVEGMLTGDALKGSSVCTTEKSAARAFEKVYARWGGDFRAVTDWGRATVCGQNFKDLARAITISLGALAKLGYVVVAVKNSLDLTKDVAANGGYRNMLVNLQCPESKHVVELQFSLWPIEQVKHSEFGHVVYELLRRCGFSARNCVVRGGWTKSMCAAIRSGRAVELNCEMAVWTEDDAAELEKMLALPSCRVSKMNCSSSSGDGVTAMMAAMLSCATVKSVT